MQGRFRNPRLRHICGQAEILGKSILITAGELSGDNVGGLLAAELKSMSPDIELFGLGGDRMGASGMEIRYHVNQLSFLGFWEVLKHLSFLKRVQKDILDQVEARKPDLAILIDYPGFNLRLAERLKERGVPIMYYVSPQVWAWGKGRIRKIKALVDRMVVVFEFEKEMYQEQGVAAEWYGHPLLEIVKPQFRKDEFFSRIGLREDSRCVGLFPGSRKQEIEKILPVMRRALEPMKNANFKAAVGCAPGIDDIFYRKFGGDNLLYIRGMTYDLMAYSELNLVASGTATLECAILGRPLFVLYKTSTMTYLIARRLIRIPYVGLVNVVAGEKIVPEFIQYNCRPDLISNSIRRFFSEPILGDRMAGKLFGLRARLGEPGGSRKTAGAALGMIGVAAD
jgi:lipid-A-disaccharide synthase